MYDPLMTMNRFKVHIVGKLLRHSVEGDLEPLKKGGRAVDEHLLGWLFRRAKVKRCASPPISKRTSF